MHNSVIYYLLVTGLRPIDQWFWQAWENNEGWNDPLLHPSHPEKLIDTGHPTVLVRDEGKKETLNGGHFKCPPFLFNYNYPTILNILNN